jgi:alpha-mannosidase
MKIGVRTCRWMGLGFALISCLPLPVLSLPVEVEIKPQNIVASSEFSSDQSVQHLVDDSGMDGDLHDGDANGQTMWHTAGNPVPARFADGCPESKAWVRFDFEQPRSIDEISIWNYNQANQTDRGFRKIRLFGSADGDKWFPLTTQDPMELPRGNGTSVDPFIARVPANFKTLKGIVIAAEAKEGNYGSPIYGLSEVKFISHREVSETDLPFPSDMICVARPTYGHRPDGQPGREILLRFKGVKLYGTATIEVECEGHMEATAIAAPGGISRLSVLLPPESGSVKSCQVHITLRARGRQLRRSLMVVPQRKWTVYIYPHSHVDIGYTAPQEFVEKLHMRNIDVGIEIARQTANYPEGARYVWNPEVGWPVEAYLRQASPQKRAAFIEAVKKGWVGLDATYGNVNTSATSDEEMLRLFRLSHELRRLTGAPIDTMMQFDVPGASWGIAQAAAQNGVHGFFSFPNHLARIGNIREAWEHKPFYWVAPDGKSRLLFMQGCPYGYGYVLKGSWFELEKVQGRVPELDRLRSSDPLAHFIDPFIFEETAKLEQAHSPYDIFVMTWSMADNCLIDADLPDAVRLWNEKYAYPKLIIAGAHEILTSFEKRYSAIIPEVRGDYTEYWTDGLGTDALRVGLNRHAKERLVDAEILWSMLNAQSPAPLQAFHDSWRNVLLGTEHTWGYSDPTAPIAKLVEATKASYFENADRSSRELVAEALKPILKTGSTSIAVLNTLSWNRGGLVTLPAAESRNVNRVLTEQGKEMPAQRLSSGELAFLASDIPAFGSRLYRLAAGKKSTEAGAVCKVGNRTLENGLVRLALNPQTGDISSLVDLRSGHEFVDTNSLYALNSYRYLPGADRSKASGPTGVVIKVKENGPLAASLVVESAAAGCNKLTREVRVLAGQPGIELINTLDKISTREKEGVHFGFAFNVAGATTRMDIPWGIMIPESDQLPGSNRNWLAFQHWVDLSNSREGVTWTSIEAPLLELGDLSANILGEGTGWLKSLPDTQTLFSWALNNHWFTNFPLEQGGLITFRYPLLLHGPFDSAESNQFALEQNRPLIAVPADKNPISKPLISFDNRNIAVSTLKPSEDGQAIILRLRSVSDRAEVLKLNWPAKEPKSIHYCLADEIPGEIFSGEIAIAPWGTASLRIEF